MKKRLVSLLLALVMLLGMAPAEVLAVSYAANIHITDSRIPYMSISSVVQDLTLTDNDYPWQYDSAEDAFCTTNQGLSSTSSTLTICFTVQGEEQLSFGYGVSSEGGYDELTVMLDGTKIVSGISGVNSGTIDKTVTAGVHTLVFTYAKDNGVDRNNDMAWFCDFAIGNCEHAEIKEMFRANGNKTHIRQNTCVNCGKVAGEGIISDCIDKDSDKLCDLCSADINIVASGYCGGEGNGTNLTWILTDDGTLTISGEGAMKDYGDSDHDCAPWLLMNVNKLIIEEGITSISNYAFLMMSSLGGTVVIPDSVQSIGYDAFYGSGISGLILGSGLKEIGGGAFMWCRGLSGKLIIPESVTKIGVSAFSECKFSGYYFEADAPQVRDYRDAIENEDYSLIDNPTFSAPLYFIPGTEGWMDNSAAYDANSGTWNGYALKIWEERYPLSLCDHSYYTIDNVEYNGDQMHTVVTICHVCGETVASQMQKCVITDVSYVSNEDKTHTATGNCGTCSEAISVVNSCSDVNSDWLCDLCSAELIEGAAERINIVGTNMTFGHDFLLNFMVRRADLDLDRTYTVRFTNLYSGEVTTVEGLSQYSSAYYRAVYEVAAWEMSDPISIEIIDEAGQVINNPYSKSVREHVLNAMTATSRGSLVGLHMLNFGAAAQKQYEHHTEDVLTFCECLNAQMCAEPEFDDLRVAGVNYMGSFPDIEYPVVLKFAFQGRNLDLSSMSAVVSFTDYMGTNREIEISGSEFTQLGTYFLVPVNYLTVADIAQMVTCAVYTADGSIYGEGSDSVSSYISRVLGASTSSSEDIYSAYAKYALVSHEYLCNGGGGSLSGLLTKETVANNDGTHSVVGVCGGCDRAYPISTTVCTDADGDGKCDVCGGGSSVCDHTNVTYTTVSNGDKTHTTTGTCADCGEAVGNAVTASCMDEDGNYLCDLCKGELCDHGQMTQISVSNKNNTHTAKIVCRICQHVVKEGEVQPCSDEDLNLQCDVCAGGYTASGYCGGEGDGTNLRWTLTPNGTITISGTGAMADFAAYASPWYGYWKHMTTLVVRDGVTSIGACAFCGCGYMTGKLELPDSVQTIGNYAFAHCCFTNVDPGPEPAPPKCSHENISENIRYIGSYRHSTLVCDDCNEILASAYCDVDQTLGGTCSFCGHTYSAKCTHSVTDQVYNHCGTNLHTTLVCADCGKTLQTESCTDTDDNDLCDKCGGKIACTHADRIEAYVSVGKDYHYTRVCADCGQRLGREACKAHPADASVCLLCGGQVTVQTQDPKPPVIIPDDETEISDHYFENCTTYTGELVLPASCVTIGTRAFYNCSGLTGDLTIPGLVQTIGVEAFDGCTGLGEELYVSASVTDIRAGAFNNTGFIKAYFLGNAPAATEATNDRPSFPADITLYYIPGMTGWTDTADYDAEAGTWKGYKLVVWEQAHECTHETVSVSYVYVGQLYHKVITVCADCGWQDSKLSSCVDADRDHKCDLCGGDHPCQHANMETTYTSNGDETHEVRNICEACGLDETRTQNCTDKNRDHICDYCEADLTCRHRSIKRTYKPSKNSTHLATAVCNDCGEVLYKDEVGGCVDNNKDERCDKCGAKIHESVLYSGPCGAEGNEDNLWWYLMSNGTLIIRGTGPMQDYEDEGKQKGAPWYQHKKLIRHLVLEEGITHIGSYAFKGCNKLEGEIVLPDSLESIGERAFQNNNKITGGLIIPHGVKVIGKHAFAGCTGLSDDLVIGKPNQQTFSLMRTGGEQTLIGESAFEGCSGFTGALIMGEGVASIGENAFAGTKFQTKVVIPATVTEIGDGAFQNCETVRNVTFCGDAPTMTSDAFDAGVSINYTEGTSGWTDADGYDAAQSSWNGLVLNVSNEAECTHSSITRSYTADDAGCHVNTAVCDLCGERVSVALQSCTDHDEDLTCDLCAAHVDRIEKISIVGNNMKLGNEFMTNFMLNASDIDEEKNYTALVTHRGKTVELPVEKYNNSYYCATFHVAAKEMADHIRVIILDENGEMISQSYTNNMQQYAMTLLNNASQNASLKSVVVDMLNYGTEAQKYFHHNEDAYANADVTEEQQAAYATAEVECVNNQVPGTNFVGANLSLEDSILLNVFFKIAHTDALTATISFTDYLGKEVTAEAAVEKYNTSLVKVVVDEIVLADAKRPVTVTVYDGDAVVGQGVESVESYVARNLTSETMGAINMAIIKFATSAYNYLGGTN